MGRSLSFKGPVLKKKNSLYKNSGTEMLIYRYKFVQNFSVALFLDTKLITFVRTEIKKAEH